MFIKRIRNLIYCISRSWSLNRYDKMTAECEFKKDLYDYLDSKDIRNDYRCDLLQKLRDTNATQIDDILYNKLSDIDKDILVRFFLKRFLNVETVLPQEEKNIDAGFETAKSIIDNAEDNKITCFVFRGRKIIFEMPFEKWNQGNDLEKRLMSYYPVAHTFELIEYEKEGFNPQNGQIILDCGAAYGDTALFFASLYPDSDIYSFEFGDEQYSYLQKNVATNKISVTTVKAFLYDKVGDYYLDNNYHILENATEAKEHQLSFVRTMSIDDYVRENNLTNIGLIKFDIEGGELNALHGAVNTIKTQRPILHIPIYHLNRDIYDIPMFINSLGLRTEISVKWTEKMVWGMDCVLFVKFV